MENIITHSSDVMLLDPVLFNEFSNSSENGIPFYKFENKTYYFSLNESKISTKIALEEFKEKLVVVKNYEKWIAEKIFQKDAPICSILEFILIFALTKNSTDIHFDYANYKTGVVKIKIDTVLYELCFLTKEQFDAILLCLKALSNMDTAKNNIPQSSSFFKVFRNKEIDCRFSTHPTIYGNRCVIRILQKKNVVNYLELNLEKNAIECIEKIIKAPNGFCIFTGPTNAGKTTLIHSILQEIAKQGVNIMTLEDPVEYKISNISQSNINENMSFFDGMKSILRQDPDVIFLGEIRDEKTAKIAIQAALTGHKVLTTLHSYSIQGALYRLIDMDIPFSIIAESLLTISTQRLVRKFDYEKNEYKNIQLIVDFCYFNEQLKQELRKKEMPVIIDNLKEIGKKLVESKITTNEEISRIIG